MIKELQYSQQEKEKEKDYLKWYGRKDESVNHVQREHGVNFQVLEKECAWLLQSIGKYGSCSNKRQIVSHTDP